MSGLLLVSRADGLWSLSPQTRTGIHAGSSPGQAFARKRSRNKGDHKNKDGRRKFRHPSGDSIAGRVELFVKLRRLLALLEAFGIVGHEHLAFLRIPDPLDIGVPVHDLGWIIGQPDARLNIL